MKSNMYRKNIIKILKFILIAITVVIVLMPVYMVLTGSLMGTSEAARNLAPVLTEGNRMAFFPIIPLYPTFEAYYELLIKTPEFFIMFFNSCKMVLPIVAGQMVVGTLSAYAFARFKFPGKKILYAVYIILMILPFQVTMVSEYIVLNSMKLIDTLAAVILPGVFSTFPVFIMIKFFKEIPESYFDAARMEGAGEFLIFLKIGIPLGKGGILSAAILMFIEYWNTIEQPLSFLETRALWPLSLYVPNISVDKAGISFAASAVMIIPAVLVFLSGQEYLEQGICAGGIKE